MIKVFLICGLLVFAIFGYGVLVGKKHVFPYSFIEKTQSKIRALISPQNRWKSLVFSNPLPADQREFNKISNEVDIKEKIKTQLMDLETFEKNDSARIDGYNINQNILNISYELNNKSFNSFSYFSSKNNSDKLSKNCAIVIYPESENNSSSKLYKQSPSNYQNLEGSINNLMLQFCDTFVPIRPNNAILSLHDGSKHMREIYFDYYSSKYYPGSWRWFNYLSSALVQLKFLKRKYKRVVLMGLSEGGRMSLLIATKINVELVVAASPLSINQARFSNREDLVIFEIMNKGFFEIKNFREKMKRAAKKILITFGTAETTTPIGGDAENRLSCQYLASVENTECLIHNRNHIYPLKEIESFLRKNL